MNEISLNGTVYNLSIDRSAIEKEGILNIHEYLVKKDNIK